jgi:hypothetical protein
MPTLSVTNRTASRLPVSSFVGVLDPNEVRQLDLTANELELTRATLVALADAGHILWTVVPTSTNADNQAEVVIGGARVLAGTGAPGGVVVGSIGDLYVDKAGGAATTLYVKESGNNTSAGWVAK